MSPFDKSLTRRSFLLQAGKTTLALPFLPSLLTRKILAAGAGGAPKRFIAIQLHHGMHPNQWFPYIPVAVPNPPMLGLTSPAYKTLPFVKKATDHYEVPLSAISGDISSILGSKFTSLRDQLLVVTGLDGVEVSGDAHYRSMLLGHYGGYGTGASNVTAGESLDQILARHIYTSTPKMAVLPINLMPNSSKSLSVKKTANGFVSEPAFGSDVAVFNALFKDLNPGTAPPPPSTLDKTIIDSTNSQLNALLSSTRLSQEDRQRLQAHLDAMHELEKGFAVPPPPPGVCAVPSIEPNSSWDVYCKNQIKNIAAAIKCGLTNIVTVDIEDGPQNYEQSTFKVDYHNDCHNHENNSKTEPVKRFLFNHIADLIASLNEVEDTTTGATYLDNTMIVIGNTVGGEPADHRINSQPILIAGKCGNALTTGRAVNFWQHDAGDYRGSFYGRGYSQLLMTILNVFGVPSSALSNMKMEQAFVGPTQKYSSQGMSPLPGMKVV